MARILRTTVVALLASLTLPGTAQAAGGDYVFEGGSPEAQATVRAALDASRFNFDRVPAQITIRIPHCGCAGAREGLIVLDEGVVLDTSLGAGTPGGSSSTSMRTRSTTSSSRTTTARPCGARSAGRKPFSPLELISLVEELLDGGRAPLAR
jgi:hypothetical protein